MKFYFKKFCLFSLVITAMMSCFALTSCGDDNDEPEAPVNANEQLIIGEWSRNEDQQSSYYHITFVEGGTGYDMVRVNNKYNIDETFQWSMNGSTLTLLWESGEIQIFTVVSVTAQELILRDVEEPDFPDHYTRVK